LFVLCSFLLVFCVGALPALVIGAILLGALSNVISNPLAQFLWCFTFAFTGGITALVFQKILLVFGTALLGAFMIVSGVDALWLNTKIVYLLPALIGSFFNGETLSLPDNINRQIFWVLVSSMLVGFIVGSILQFKFLNPSKISIPQKKRSKK